MREVAMNWIVISAAAAVGLAVGLGALRWWKRVRTTDPLLQLQRQAKRRHGVNSVCRVSEIETAIEFKYRQLLVKLQVFNSFPRKCLCFTTNFTGPADFTMSLCRSESCSTILRAATDQQQPANDALFSRCHKLSTNNSDLAAEVLNERLQRKLMRFPAAELQFAVKPGIVTLVIEFAELPNNSRTYDQAVNLFLALVLKANALPVLAAWPFDAAPEMLVSISPTALSSQGIGYVSRRLDGSWIFLAANEHFGIAEDSLIHHQLGELVAADPGLRLIADLAANSHALRIGPSTWVRSGTWKPTAAVA